MEDLIKQLENRKARIKKDIESNTIALKALELAIRGLKHHIPTSNRIKQDLGRTCKHKNCSNPVIASRKDAVYCNREDCAIKHAKGTKILPGASK